MKVTEEEFEELVTEAISSLPKKFKEKMENVVVVIESLPSQELLMDFWVFIGESLIPEEVSGIGMLCLIRLLSLKSP